MTHAHVSPSPRRTLREGTVTLGSEDTVDWARSLVSREQRLADDAPNVSGVLERLCRAAAGALPSAGVGISVVSPAGGDFAVAASDVAHHAIEELQFTVGEGPCLAAFESGGPVLTSDLAEAARGRWPGYGPAVAELGVRAVFAFPLQVGGARLGALDVYQQEVGPLSARATTRALRFAEVALENLLESQARGGADAGAGSAEGVGIEDVVETRVEVYQAQGMVMIQLGLSLEQAMSRLRAYCYAHDRRLIDVASDIVERKVTLNNDSF